MIKKILSWFKEPKRLFVVYGIAYRKHERNIHCSYTQTFSTNDLESTPEELLKEQKHKLLKDLDSIDLYHLTMEIVEITNVEAVKYFLK